MDATKNHWISSVEALTVALGFGGFNINPYPAFRTPILPVWFTNGGYNSIAKTINPTTINTFF